MKCSVPLVLWASLGLCLPAAGQLVPRDGSSPIAVKSHRVEATVEDGLAYTTVRQTFVNSHGRPLEAVYLFPLPEDATLVDVAMVVDGKRLEGLLTERKRARRIYDDIVRSKRDPALVEQVGRNLFRLSVFPVMPDQETLVELSWTQSVPLRDGAFRYVYPLAGGGGATRTEQDLSITVRVRSTVPITKVEASRDDVHIVQPSVNEAIASLEESKAVLDQDLVVTVAVATPKTELEVRTYREDTGDGWFLATITPPVAREDQLLARDVTLVLDTSGSMSEGKIEQAKASALWLLDHLRPADRVNVIAFSSDVRPFAAEPVPATPDNLSRLATFVHGLRAKGSTAMGDALRAATAVEEVEGRVRSVVFLTDGLPTVGETDPARLIEIAKGAGDKGLRIFPFGVGEDVDSALLRGIASAGRGRAEVFRPGGEIETRLTSFLVRTSSPVLSEVSLAVDGLETYDLQPRPLPDLYLGEQLVIAGRYLGGGQGMVTVTATQEGRRGRLAVPLEFLAEAGGSPHVKHIFARQKLDFLEEARRLRMGLTDDAYYAALDRGAYSTEAEIVGEMIDVSLSHGVQCAYTSFLVLLDEDRRRIDARDVEAIDDALARLREQTPERDAPIVQDFELSEGSYDTTAGDPDLFSDSPFDDKAFNNVIGIGGSAGGKFGARFGGKRHLREAGGSGTKQALEDGLKWLQAHQDPDGMWDADDFMKHDPPNDRCTAPGDPLHDVGNTGLALLAFLGDGNTLRRGPYRQEVVRGIKWLRQQQDYETGRIGTELLDHVLASLAICEAYYFSRSPLLKGTAQRAVDHIVRSRGAAWSAVSDPMAMGWIVATLTTARDAGLAVDAEVMRELLAWIERHTGDPDEPVARTAMGLLSQVFLGQAPDDHPVMREQADRILRALPVPSTSPEARYYSTLAMYQMGGRYWNEWNAPMQATVLDAQRHDGAHEGSWDVSSSSVRDGRIASTAVEVLCLEAYFRYARLMGSR